MALEQRFSCVFVGTVVGFTISILGSVVSICMSALEVGLMRLDTLIVSTAQFSEAGGEYYFYVSHNPSREKKCGLKRCGGGGGGVFPCVCCCLLL